METIVNTLETMLKNEKFKKPISGELSEYLRKHTSGRDRMMAAVNTRVSSSTINSLLLTTDKRASLQETNIEAVKELIRIAIKNCETSIEDSKKAMKELKSILNEK